VFVVGAPEVDDVAGAVPVGELVGGAGPGDDGLVGLRLGDAPGGRHPGGER
jgi:hypothetical protein